MSGQWAVVFFHDGSTQVMTDAVGPFRSREAAEAVVEPLDAALHEGANPQFVQLHSFKDAIRDFGVEELND